MEFIWAGERNAKNRTLVFSMDLSKYKNFEKALTLNVCAVDFYWVFANGELISYGPSRAPAGFVRARTIDLSDAEKLEILVSAYNVDVSCYACDIQLPFFGAEILCDGKTVAGSYDFTCRIFSERVEKAPYYGFQRGYVQLYDYTNVKKEPIATYAVEAPTILGEGKDTADYKIAELSFLSKKPFSGFDKVLETWWETYPEYALSTDHFDVHKDFIEETLNGNYIADSWVLPAELSGFIRLDVEAETEVKIFAVFEEYLPNGEWVFRRDCCNSFVSWVLPKGKFNVLCLEPYSVKHLKIIYQGKAVIKPSLIRLENATPACVSVSGNKELETVFAAAESTFRQNAVDIFTDCPSRERAGWLCDSYFTAIAERLFTGNNEIERRFLENFILGELDEIPHGMLPDCFPAQHADGKYIPNWAMWFILELEQYFLRTGDRELVNKAKEKVYGVIEHLDKYLNEDGLLEDLESWVFVEWSVCNDDEYVAGVNYPSNMIYSATLSAAARLYGNERLLQRSKKMKETIVQQAFVDGFFVDNAIRENGKLVPQKTHLSETCQYYALFFDVPTSDDYKRKMIERFGAFRQKDEYPEVAKSNMFIGNYLRFFWLCEQKEYERVLRESVDVFTVMANETGTLWEHLSPHASCNHGFASVIAVLLLQSTVGYKTTVDGAPVFDENFVPTKDYGLSVCFSYPNKEKCTIKG